MSQMLGMNPQEIEVLVFAFAKNKDVNRKPLQIRNTANLDRSLVRDGVSRGQLNVVVNGVVINIWFRRCGSIMRSMNNRPVVVFQFVRRRRQSRRRVEQLLFEVIYRSVPNEGINFRVRIVGHRRGRFADSRTSHKLSQVRQVFVIFVEI